MRTLDRKLRREFRSAFGRLLAVTSIIAVGVACYVEMESCYTNLVDAKQRYYTRCRMADFSLEVKKLPVSELSLLSRFPEVLELRPRIQFFATVDLERAPRLLNGQVLSLPDRPEPTINDIVLKRGSYFTDTRDNEVIVNDGFAKQHGLSPGQWIHLILNNRRQELFIVGTAISSEFVYLVGPGAITPDPQHFGVFYLKHRYAEEVFNFEGACNQVLGRLTPAAKRHPEDLLRQMEVILEPFGVFSSTPLKDQPSNRYISDEMDGLATFGKIMPGIFLSVAALVLNILMARWTDQQRTIVGTLKALGYGDGQVLGHFLKFGLTVGFLGGAIGCFLGFLLARWVTGIYGTFYEFPDLRNRVYADLWLIGLAISLLCAILGTLYGAYGVLRLRPAEAMRTRAPRRGGAIVLEKVTFFWRRLGFSWRLVLRDVWRQPVRTGAGLFASAMGASILLTGFTMHEAIFHLIDFQFRKVQAADLELSFKDERGIEALDEAKNLPGVDHAEPFLSVACTFHFGPYRRKGSITGIRPDARLTTPRDRDGNRLRIPDAGLVMSRKLAELLHVSVGDVLTVEPTKGLKLPRRVPLASIADGYLGMSVYADIHYLNWLVGEEFAVSGVQLALDKDARNLRRLHGELKELPGVQAISARADAIKNLEDTVIKTQKTFIGLLIVFAGVIFFGSVLNSSLIGLAERQAEVATLRVLGYGPWEVGGIFLRESMTVNLAGTLLGIPLGYRLCHWLADAHDTELFRIPVVYAPWVIATTLVLSVVFGLLAHAFVQRGIHKMDWLEALKVRE
ncbi:MAG: ABC transporter permease [Planctomycetia bacterium]|nr:ABC transporter permease [Planctomycetia bacterium]